ncbi:hypothetical protein [Corynebacterium sputi]|uniref:hypothetical protein n=1 Tax=Corynebacterium sputi TaxID=489915 RepID=UPI000400F54A|nr:hypothetical protein [Corynebacterium sputi]
MDNYIALIEALSGFAPDTITVEVLPGFESITGGGDANLLTSGEDLGLVNVDGNLGLANAGEDQVVGLFAAGDNQANGVGGPVVGGDHASDEAVQNTGEGNIANAPLSQANSGDTAQLGGQTGDGAAQLGGQTVGDGDLNNPLGQTLREGLIGQGGILGNTGEGTGGLLNTGQDNGGLLGGGLGGLNLGL